MITGGAVDAALHGVDEHSALHGGLGDASGEIEAWRNRLLAGLVGNEFDCPEQADAAHVADRRQIAQVAERLTQLECRGTFDF